jgi:hypothetical protein
MKARIGVWRPTIEERSCLDSPLTWASVTIGIAIAPKATGAVSASRHTAAALTGRSPSETSITPQIAAGVPKPASASSRAPKQKAIMITCTRMSVETDENERRRTAKCPVSTVRL